MGLSSLFSRSVIAFAETGPSMRFTISDRNVTALQVPREPLSVTASGWYLAMSSRNCLTCGTDVLVTGTADEVTNTLSARLPSAFWSAGLKMFASVDTLPVNPAWRIARMMRGASVAVEATAMASGFLARAEEATAVEAGGAGGARIRYGWAPPALAPLAMSSAAA